MADRRHVVVLAVLALVAVSSGAGLAAATHPSSSPPSQQGSGMVAGTANQPYRLSTLKQDGKHYQVPSNRIVPSAHRLFSIEHRPVNQPWVSITPQQHGAKLKGHVKTDTLYLRSISAGHHPRSMNVTLVYYGLGTRTVTRGNQSTTVQEATNESVVHQSVTLRPGEDVAAIHLKQSPQQRHVTMWLDKYPQQARWTFTHQSVAFMTPIHVQNWMDFVMLAVGFVVLPALVFGGYGAHKVKGWIQQAGEPPGHGFLYYAIAATVLTAIIVYAAYTMIASVIVAVPVVLGVYVGVVYLGYMLATHSGTSESKLFFQPHIEAVDSFTSTKLPTVGSGSDDQTELSFSEDMPFGQMQSYRVLDEGQNGLSIIRNGWYAFLARLKGGRARIENADELKTRMSLWNSHWDEVFIVDPDADTLIDYQPPGLTLRTPTVESWTDLIWPAVLLGGGGLVAWRAAQSFGATAWALIFVAVPILVWKFAVVGTDSHVHIEPAPAALRPVLASMLVMQVGYRDAAKLEEAEEFAWRALSDQEKTQMAWERNRDSTFVDDTFRDPSGDADQDIDGDDDGTPISTPPDDDEGLIDSITGDGRTGGE